MRKASLTLLTVFATIGCATTGSYCQIARPIYLDEQSLSCMTADTARQILTINQTWQALCQ